MLLPETLSKLRPDTNHRHFYIYILDVFPLKTYCRSSCEIEKVINAGLKSLAIINICSNSCDYATEARLAVPPPPPGQLSAHSC